MYFVFKFNKNSRIRIPKSFNKKHYISYQSVTSIQKLTANQQLWSFLTIYTYMHARTRRQQIIQNTDELPRNCLPKVLIARSRVPMRRGDAKLTISQSTSFASMFFRLICLHKYIVGYRSFCSQVTYPMCNQRPKTHAVLWPLN